jgi:hypothetical protein
LKIFATDSCVLVYDSELFVLDQDTLELRAVHLGHVVAIGALSVKSTAEGEVSVVAILLESQRLVRFRLEITNKTATYSKALPFKATMMATAAEPSATDLYIIGTLERINRAALLVLMLDKSRVGLVGINDAVSVSGVLPFNEVREEPVSISLWGQEMFPDGGLLAIGTKGHIRGRLILFERASMHAIAKTSVPSTVVSALCELSRSVLVVGCDDCVALVGLRPGPRTMPVVLYTIASFSTYSLVKHVSRVDDSRFLCVTENGVVQLFKLVGETLAVEASMESWARVRSRCHIMPGNETFVCSADDSEMLTCSLREAASGLIKILKAEKLGAAITSACIDGDKLVATTSTKAILQIALDQSARTFIQSS